VDLRFLRTWSALAISTSSGAVELLGYAAATLTTVSFIPQAIKTLRTGDTRSISFRMYSLFTLGIALWGVYGVLVGDGPLIAAITLITAGLILDRKWRALWSDHRKSRGSINQPRA
jgi:MtN3 and saliva related transmembrane protein